VVRGSLLGLLLSLAECLRHVGAHGEGSPTASPACRGCPTADIGLGSESDPNLMTQWMTNSGATASTADSSTGGSLSNSSSGSLDSSPAGVHWHVSVSECGLKDGGDAV
jgi:hypothetical protein